MSKSIVNLAYLEPQPSSAAWEGDPIHTYYNVASMAFQVVYASAPVMGTWTVEGTIYPGLWETLQDCDPLTVSVSAPGHTIVVLPDTANFQEYLRLRWEPLPGSTGMISAAIRILPA